MKTLNQDKLKLRKQVFDINENQHTATEYQIYQSTYSCSQVHKDITIVDRYLSCSYIYHLYKQYCWSYLWRNSNTIAENFKPEESLMIIF